MRPVRPRQPGRCVTPCRRCRRVWPPRGLPAGAGASGPGRGNPRRRRVRRPGPRRSAGGQRLGLLLRVSPGRRRKVKACSSRHGGHVRGCPRKAWMSMLGGRAYTWPSRARKSPLVLPRLPLPAAKSTLTRPGCGVLYPSSPTKWGQVVNLGGGRRAHRPPPGHRATHGGLVATRPTAAGRNKGSPG
jgi:hypothetical protein